jgi:hypothetical protein
MTVNWKTKRIINKAIEKKGIKMKTILLCLALLAPAAAPAQFKCTMPSGVVTFNRLSPCPADAVKAEPLERVPDAVQPQFKGEYRASAPLPPAPRAQAAPRPTAPAQPKERDIVSEAYGVCGLLKAVGATTCTVEVNVFSASYIDATLPTTPRDAQGVCRKILVMSRAPGSPFIGRGWQLKLFSPLGSGTRPMAQCTL